MTPRPSGPTPRRSGEHRPRVAIDLTALDDRAFFRRAVPMPIRFVNGLIRHAPEVDFVLLARPAASEALAHLAAANVRRLSIAEPSRLQSLLARIQVRLRRRGLLRKLRVDLLFCPFTNSRVSDPAVPMVAAVHDLQHLSHPHLLTAPERAARARAFSDTCRRADRIVCSTPSLRDVALRCAGVLPERVLTVAPGSLLTETSATQPAVAEALARHGLRENGFFLFAADFEPRHNHRLVLTAFAIFRARRPGSEVRLVCVGDPERSMASLRTAADGMRLGAAVHFFRGMPNEELAALIQGCRAVVVASLYETIGEAVREGMARGRPVLCSQVPDLAELAAGAAVMFEPHRPADLAEAFERIDREPAVLDPRAQLGPRRVAALADAQSVARAYLDVFRAVGLRNHALV